MKKPHGVEEGAGSWELALGEVSRLFPLIVEYLAADRWDDGTPRERSTLLMFVDGLRWKVCLNDRALGRVAFVSGVDPEEVLSSLEEALAKDSLDWRAVQKRKVVGNPRTS